MFTNLYGNLPDIDDNDYYLGVYICLCNGVTEQEIRACAEKGAHCLRDLERCLGVGIACGRCKPAAKQVLNESRSRPELRGAPA